MFSEFNKQNIKYLVERNYEQLPYIADNDVDLLVSPTDIDKFMTIIQNNARDCKIDLVLVTKAYGGGRIYLWDSWSRNNDICRIDYMTAIHYKGLPLLNIHSVIENRQRRSLFYIPDSCAEIAMSLMIPLMYNGQVKEKYKQFIYDTITSNDTGFVLYLRDYLPSNILEEILYSILRKDFEYLNNLRKVLLKACIIQNCAKSAVGFINYLVRYVPRIFKSPGIFICLLGPDGSGKSTVMENLTKRLAVLYPAERFKKKHWRPGALPQLKQLLKVHGHAISSTDRHYNNKENPVRSLLRFIYYILDYVIGYYLKLFPMMIKTTAIIMDRYYYDIIVDPFRYGFNLPRWLLKLGRFIVPKPDLTVYLDNTADKLHRRKKELSVGELDRQIHIWRRFIADLPNAKIVTTDKSLREVVEEVARFVLAKRTEKTRKTLKLEPRGSEYIWKNNLSPGHVALPSKDNCRWILPSKPILAQKSWELYRPYSIRGCVYKKFMKIVSQANCLKLLKRNNLILQNTDESNQLCRVLQELFNDNDLTPALSTGTPGPFHKIICLVLNSKAGIIGYAKIGKAPHAIERIKNEAKILRELKIIFKDGKILTPECLYEGRLGKAYMIILSSPSFVNNDTRMDFDENYVRILNRIIMKTNTKKSFVKSIFFRRLKNAIGNYPLSFRDLLKNAFVSLRAKFDNKDLFFTLAHGDFVPWNIISNGKEVFIYDWESADFEAPAALDLVHLLFQTGYLLKKMRGTRLLNHIMNEKLYDLLLKKSGINILPIDDLVIIYLLKMAVGEDAPQVLSKAAVERRRLIKLMVTGS